MAWLHYRWGDDTVKGRRRPDLKYGLLHDNIQAGDYWKILGDDGLPRISLDPGNLTKTCWHVVVPLGKGYGLGRLVKHTVREHDDGTISVRPGDGSSNSILVSKGQGGPSWHGYIEHGEFQEA